MTRRPNVVLILTDDHAAHAISAYGSVVNRTPRIDSLAADGALVTECVATNALCAPSRASILTGTYSHVNGVTTLSTHVDASQPTFVSQLRAQGYRTAVVGKWHMGAGDGHDPEGFDHWDVLIDQGEYHDPRFRSATGVRTVPGYATDVITDLALDWLDGLEGDDPWCLLVWHKAPHRPWEPHPRHADLFTDPVPVPATFDDDHATRSASARRATLSVAHDLTAEDLKEDPPPDLDDEGRARWAYQRYLQDYLRCVAAVDENVGRVLDHLDERGEADDTVVLYSSDQGFFLGDHGWYDKRFLYTEAVRMPLLVRYPRGVAAGSTLAGPVTNVDLARTLLDAAGVAPHPRMQGRSWWPELIGADNPEPVPDGVYYRYWEHDDASHHVPAHYGYRTDRYTLVYFYNDGLGLPGTGPATAPPEWELYDRRADPTETRNVADDPAYAEARADLEAAMWRAQAEVGDRPHPSQQVPERIAAPG